MMQTPAERRILADFPRAYNAALLAKMEEEMIAMEALPPEQWTSENIASYTARRRKAQVPLRLVPKGDAHD